MQGISRAADAGYRVLSCRAAQTRSPAVVHGARRSSGADSSPRFRLATGSTTSRTGRRAAARRVGGAAPNPRAIGTAIVSLLSQLWPTPPLLLAIDDLQWLDLPSARALEFALRRLDAQPIAVLATVRLGERSGVDVCPRNRQTSTRVASVRSASARCIESSRTKLGHALPRPLLVKIERACGGNPFYALEIARALESAANLVPSQDLPIPDDLRELVAKRLRKLPRRTREALLRVSALAQPTISLVDPADLAPAEEAGVVRVRTTAGSSSRTRCSPVPCTRRRRRTDGCGCTPSLRRPRATSRSARGT